MTVAELRQALGARGQDKGGNKAELIARLVDTARPLDPASGTDPGDVSSPPVTANPVTAKTRCGRLHVSACLALSYGPVPRASLSRMPPCTRAVWLARLGAAMMLIFPCFFGAPLNTCTSDLR